MVSTSLGAAVLPSSAGLEVKVKCYREGPLQHVSREAVNGLDFLRDR